MSLRNVIVRLANEKPELRQHLVPLLNRTASTSKEALQFDSEDALRKYMKEHPNANPARHSVKPSTGKDLQDRDKKVEKKVEKNKGKQEKREKAEKSKAEKAKSAPKSEGKGKPEGKGKSESKEPKFKKNYAKPVKDVMVKHDLTDTDADEVKAFKKSKPEKGTPVSPAVLMQRFLAKAKPETKERMKGVSPAEFMKMLAAIMDEEGGEGGKKK